MMRLDSVVPFGRSLDEYCKMFNLSPQDLGLSLLSVADGPASFNAEMLALGHRVISIDPIYRFDAAAIERQFYAVCDNIIDQVKATPENWVWSYHSSPEHLRQNRISVLRQFVADYPAGRMQGRYLTGELPVLNCADSSYDLALCSHFLFLYSDLFDYAFHTQSVLELLRVAREVRIFPLITLSQEQSPHLAPLLNDLSRSGHAVRIETVSYQLQKGGNTMLRIYPQSQD